MTAIADTFNRADSGSTLGTTSDGFGAWTAVKGTWGIATNKAYTPALGAGGWSLAKLAVGEANGVITLTSSTVVTGAAIGPAFRIQDASNCWITGGGGVFKVVAGSFTQMIALPSITSGDILEVTFAGSAISLKQNGSLVGTASDSFLASMTDHGMYGDATSELADDWSFASAVAPPASRVSVPITVRSRAAVMRAAVR